MRRALSALRGARVLLAHSKSWTRYAMARTRDGKKCYPLAPEATCWCLEGAVSKAALQNHDGGFVRARDLLVELLDGMSLDAFNDQWETTHRDVLALLDAAIAQAERESACATEAA